jgi:hypothetical protein
VLEYLADGNDRIPRARVQELAQTCRYWWEIADREQEDWEREEQMKDEASET